VDKCIPIMVMKALLYNLKISRISKMFEQQQIIDMWTNVSQCPIKTWDCRHRNTLEPRYSELIKALVCSDYRIVRITGVKIKK
jgi:hypothetical protein